MRGKRAVSTFHLYNPGITPADAGKTVIGLSYMQRHQDHPRGCGENSEVKRMNVFNLGSPPRMRGKLNVMVFTEGTDRITPADAGKTCHMLLHLDFPRDHPRGCGENEYAEVNQRVKAGSPPRMRGKHESV